MLWYKSWHDTRKRFLFGLVLLAASAVGTVVTYPQVVQLLAAAPNLNIDGALGREVAESAALAQTYRGYIWSQWFAHNMPQLWCLFAVILGTGGIVTRATCGRLYTLSLPISRNRLVSVRAAIGLAELLVLAVVPALLLPLVSPSVGQHYAMTDALVHAGCLFVAGSVFFSLAFLLSSVFTSVWPPLLTAIAVAAVMSLIEQAVPGLAHYGFFRIVGAESYFRGDGLPWIGLIASAIVSAALLYGAALNVARHDF